MDSSRMILWWEPEASVYRIKVPHNTPQLIQFLKDHIPWDKRDYDSQTHIWSFAEDYLIIMKFILDKIYPGRVEVHTKEEIEQRMQQETTYSKQRTSTHRPVELPNAKLRFYEFTGFQITPQTQLTEARKAYLHGVKRLHPDLGGNSILASELNVVWMQIREELKK